MLHAQNLDEVAVKLLGLDLPAADLSEWQGYIDGYDALHDEVHVAMVGKYVHLTEAYKSLSEALTHAGVHTGSKVKIHYIDSEKLEQDVGDQLRGMDAILVPGGFGERGVEGKIAAVRFAREQGIPYLGICLGMQVAVIEYARNVAGLTDAHSTEFNPDSPNPVIALITEWLNADGKREQRDENSDLGGTMRLGGQECRLEPDSKVRELYGEEVIVERHRHRYEFNNSYLDRIVTAGMKIAGRSIDGRLMEIVEITDHPWFIACQFHPEFTSRPRYGHPLFSGFIEAARKHRDATA